MRRTTNREPGASGWRARLLGALVALVVLPAALSAQTVDDKYQRNRDRNSQFNLNAGPTAVLRVNQYQCGLKNDGDICTDVFDSPTGGGGFWPTGSPNQYMFNSGLQLTGIITMGAGCTTALRDQMRAGLPPQGANCFAWSGDTVGAFMMDASGLRKHGSALVDIYDSLDPNDLANWPGYAEGSNAVVHPDFPTASAMVQDTALFNPVLIGRRAASQQDTWTMYWDGDPSRTGGRTHPMGILVEQRTLAWNYPTTGNESVIYFIWKFTNVTNNPLFQRLNETRYAISLPDEGWAIDSLYVAYNSDPDVTHDYALNYATPIFPFNLGVAYDGSFFEPDGTYPPALFHAPFFPNAPGLLGVKYLQSPVNPATGQEVGLTAFSLTTVSGTYADPNTVQKMWRFHSLNVDPSKGDPSCTFPLAEIKARRSCYLAQTTADVRFYIASGPFTLEPGQSATVAAAQYVAATVATPLITRGANERNPPGLPTLAPGCNGEPIRPIEVAAGYIRPINCPPPGEPINQFDVEVVRKSLLGRALVAQSIYDNKFLLGFAPDAPTFYLVPGNNQVTVIWEPSPTEQEGDPFFAAAGDPANPLYDENYREFDVEGYRIYRGTSPANMELVAQFDKQGTVFRDVLCITDPEHISGFPCESVREIPITHPFVQYESVVELGNGLPFVLEADTALAEQVAAGTSRQLTDTGIPYTFIDTDVRNGFQYFYRVTAFDINSVRAGPTSLESSGVFKPVIPQRASTSLSAPQFELGVFGRATTELTGTMPTLNPVTGQFSGPMPPTDLWAGDFTAFAPQLLPVGATEMRIDSIWPGYYPSGVIGRYFITAGGQQTVITFTNRSNQAAPGTSESFELPVVTVESDASIRQQLVAQGVDAPPLAGSIMSTLTIDRPHWHSNQANWAYKQPAFWQAASSVPASWPGGSRWFTGANESAADPTLGLKVHGSLPGMTIFKPQPYLATGTPSEPPAMSAYVGRDNTSRAADLFRRIYGTAFGVQRAADMRFYWGAAGLDSVVDVTHNVRVTYHPHMQATYGFLRDGDGNGVLNYGDFYYVPQTGVARAAHEVSHYAHDFPSLLAEQPVVLPTDVTGNLQSDGQGFGLLVAGEPYLFVGPVPTNTVWTLRTYNGAVTRSEAGVYSFQPTGRTPAVPGLRFNLQVTAPAQVAPAEADLTRVHTVPDPYYAVSLYDLGPASKELQFVNLPAQATIRIYSLSGVLVDVINHNDPGAGGMAKWDLRNRSSQFVASGVYLFHVSTPEGRNHVGKFTVINSGIAR